MKSARSQPEAADLQHLWQELDSAIAPLEKNQQLQVAAEAISQIVEIYVSRANGVLDSLDVTDSSNGPVLGDDFLCGLMRQSMSLDLSDMMEDLFPLADCQVSVSSGSQVTPIDKKVAKEIARQARKLAKKDLLELTGSENIELWQQVIAHWMQQHQGHKVSLWQLQQALGMPLVKVWRLAAAFPPRCISGIGRGGFIGMQGIFGSAIDKYTLRSSLHRSKGTLRYT